MFSIHTRQGSVWSTVSVYKMEVDSELSSYVLVKGLPCSAASYLGIPLKRTEPSA